MGFAVLAISNGCRNTRDVVLERQGFDTSAQVDSLLNHFVDKYHTFIVNFRDSTRFPRTIRKGELMFTTSSEWTSGFFPGILWNLYRYSDEDDFRKAAISWSHALLSESSNTSTHDIGFIINCSAGHGYRITRKEYFKDTLLKAAESLATRYSEKTGCIKSLDSLHDFSFPVLIDNLVNLEILFKAWKFTGDDHFYNIAYSHALKTMENQLQMDFSVYQLVDYDPERGYPVYKGTFHGYDSITHWMRGQTWGVYGYTMAFRETKDRIFLDLAERLADYILDHPGFSEENFPFRDQTAPIIPQIPMDASAAAILASALIELSTFEETSDQEKYFIAGENIIQTLGEPEYCSAKNENNFFVVKHCIGNYLGKTEVGVPMIYADYYFLEALLKYSEKVNHG
jgi:hypothetical protein